MRPVSFAAGIALVLAVCVLAPVAAQATTGSRLRPPPLACDVNQLTAWTGRVTGYTRHKASTWLRIATDEDTVEATTIAHPGAATAAAHYRLNGAPFTPADFARIEAKPGKLRAGMRARAWICADGVTPPVIDWQPPAE